MKLLFDENLSPQLVTLLNDLFPDSIHVRDVGLKAADDRVVWEHAQDNDLIICSKDSDMHQRSFALVILLKLCGCDWAIVRLRTLSFACENTSRQLKRSLRTSTHHFWHCRKIRYNDIWRWVNY
jgi:predicted nuclease of predicted toxin-antitoxin system